MKNLLKYIIPTVIIGLLMGGFAYADNPNFWILNNNFIKPLTSTWNLMVGVHTSNPTEADGGIYYNSSSKTFQCGINGNWQNCATATSTGGSLSGSGTNGQVAYFSASSTITSASSLLDNGTIAGVNASSSTVSFNIQGSGNLNPFNVASSSGTSYLTIGANGSTTLSSLALAGNVQSTASGSLYVNGQTGSGLNVLQVSPTLTTPILGTASATALSISGNLYTNAVSCPNLQTNGGGLVACNNTTYQPLITFPISYASSTATTTNVIYSDVNRTDTYTSNGSIVYPYKTIATMLGASAWGSGNAYYLAPGTYVDGAPDTFPNTPFYLAGNESTYVPASGVTFPGSFDIYDLTIAGNVTESDNNLQTIHQFNNGVITGNLTTAGLATLNAETLVGTTSNFTILPGSIANYVGTQDFARVITQGIGVLNDAEVVRTDNSNFNVTATTTGSQEIAVGVTLVNLGTGGTLNVSNGATSSPNFLSNLSITTNSSTPGSSITAGNAATFLCDYTATNLVGATIYATGTNWVPCIDASLTVQATTTLLGIKNSFLATDPNGVIIATTTPSGGSGNSAWTIGSGKLYNATSTDLVAIGTITPTTTLTIQGKGGTNPFLISSSTGVSLFQINSTGIVGIGTTTAPALLTLQGSSGSTADLFDIASSTGQNIFQVLNSSQSVLSVGTSSTASNLIVQGNSSFPTKPLFILASSTGATVFEIDANGHKITGGASPTCGAGCSSVTGDDQTFRAVTGTGVTAVTVNFAVPYAYTPACFSSDESGGITVSDASSTPSSVTMNLSASLTTKSIAVICQISSNFTQ